MKNTRKQNNPSPIEEVKSRIFAIHGDAIVIDEKTYICISKSARFIHKIWGEWWPNQVSDVLRGSSHIKERALKSKISKIIPLDTVKFKIFEHHGDTVKIVEESYVAMAKKATFEDVKYGQWSALVCFVSNGACHPKRSRDSRKIRIEEVKKRLSFLYEGCVTIIENTYSSVGGRAHFVDSIFGEFECIVISVLTDVGCHPKRKALRRAETNIKKTGFPYPSQNKETALKASKTTNHTYLVYHWKTDEEIVCKASYELKVAEYLNANKIDFEWQPRIFTTPFLTSKGNLSTYRPDLFLVKENKWIEIKGWMRPISQKKWDWFHVEYPNSELWNKPKLENMGIL
jgi:hypothetical protein